ncbi:MAG TPA: M1 family metallopeptidase [Cyclobacteriaceae bacterium]
MHVVLDVKTHILKGTQKLVYHNNSPDTLTKVYYHLYFNAFQPGSMMDVRSRYIADPDQRIGDRISKLQPDEIGYQKVSALKQDGMPVVTKQYGTLLEVQLAKPLLPRSATVLELQFEAQVPIQIRRSGRNNSEGIDYSMAQWYPKLAEYDPEGWHLNPYVAREFHAVWGDYQVNITIDSRYVVAGTGVLVNADSIGHGYESNSKTAEKARKRNGATLTWRFRASNVHDFAWAADPDYRHLRTRVPNGPELHFFYQPNSKTKVWESLPELTVRFFQFMNEHVGPYPYETYSVIQAGDGGMEYAMCTFVVGEGKPASTISTVYHEAAHAWFQGVVATNEAAYAWMDEGFAQYYQNEAKAAILDEAEPHRRVYDGYRAVVRAGKEEPMAQWADFFTTNDAYRTASYFKGCIILRHLKYIVGDENFRKAMRAYYATWQFRHPNPSDFIRIMEKASGMQLKWYLNLWVHTTKQIDYAVQGVETNPGSSVVRLTRKGELPMPIDLKVTYRDGTEQMVHIPLNETVATKPVAPSWHVAPTWNWVEPNYFLELSHPGKQVARIDIDPSGVLADVIPQDNSLIVSPGE